MLEALLAKFDAEPFFSIPFAEVFQDASVSNGPVLLLYF